MQNNISQILTPDRLRKAVGEPIYSRGVEYFEEGRVKHIEIDDESIYAKVQGSQVYRVKLWRKNDKLGYSCTCPFHLDNQAVCKHCVAVVLEFLETNEQNQRSEKTKNGISGNTLKYNDLVAYLKSLDKPALVELLKQHAKINEELRSTLYLKAGRSGKRIIPTFKREIDRAVNSNGYVDYRSVEEYSEKIENVIDSLDELLEEGHAHEVIEISEYFLKSVDAQIDTVDDSYGHLDAILESIQDIHYEACLQAKPEPALLAKKLFTLELQSDGRIFHNAPTRFAKLFGKEGLRVYAELAEKEWAKIPALKPGQERDSFTGNRYRMTSIMENLASKTKNIETLVTIKKKDLSIAYSYLTIAEMYKNAEKKAEALEWAEEGVRIFPIRTDSRLREFLANEYHVRKRHDEAMKLIWAEFSESLRLEEYKLLKRHAERTGGHEAWGKWREKALDFIRTQIQAQKRKARNHQWNGHSYDHSELVRIFLWENKIDTAWREAQEGGCKESLWRDLAAKREKNHPEDAVAVYQSLVEPIIQQMNNKSYRDAATLVRKIGLLYQQLGKVEQWNHYRETLSTVHKKKRNFMALLEKIQ